MTSNTITAAASPLRGLLTLRNVLRFDAFTCASLGVLLLAGQEMLSSLLGLSPLLLQVAGLILFPSALAMVVAAAAGSKALVWLVVAGNLAWIVASLVVVALAPLTALGHTFVIVQAVAVGALAWLEATLRD